MNRSAFLVIAALLAPTAVLAQAAPAEPAPAVAAAAATPISVETTPVDELLTNPAAMEVLFKHFPDLRGHEDDLAMAGSMTLRDIQAFDADIFTDEKLAETEADLAKLPAN